MTKMTETAGPGGSALPTWSELETYVRDQIRRLDVLAYRGV